MNNYKAWDYVIGIGLDVSTDIWAFRDEKWGKAKGKIKSSSP